MSHRFTPRKNVQYTTPLVEEIHTELYTKTHAELLAEDASPFTPSFDDDDNDDDSDASASDSEDGRSRDGGHTPGPMEDMRRKMADLGGRRRRGRKREWVWTLGTPDDENGPNEEMRDIRAMSEQVL
jgi:hypothetical protein